MFHIVDMNELWDGMMIPAFTIIVVGWEIYGTC